MPRRKPPPPGTTQHIGGPPPPVEPKLQRLVQRATYTNRNVFYKSPGQPGEEVPNPVPRPGGRKVIALILEWWNDLPKKERARLLPLKDYAIAGEFCRSERSKDDDQRNIARRIKKLRGEDRLRG